MHVDWSSSGGVGRLRSWLRPRAFVSYSRKDQVIARRVYESVSAAGFDTFLDEEETLTGERFDHVIVCQLRRADVIVAVISNASAASTWCLAELSYAHALNKHVAPIQVGPDSVPLPQPLDWLQRSIHRLSVEQAASSREVVSRLAQDLAAARRRRLARLTRGLVVACALTAIVVLGWMVTVRTLDSASRDRSRAAIVEAVEDSDRTLQRATVETLADGFKDDVTLLQRLRFIANSPDRPDVQRLNALMLDNELTTARDPRSRWYIADVSWSDAELSGASLTAVTFQTGTISNVRFTRTHFAGVLWNQSPLNGAPGLMLSNVRFEGSRFEGGEFAGTGGVGVQFVNSHFTGTRLVLENFAATAFKSQSRDPNSPVITDEVTVFERAVVEHCVAKPEPGVLEIVPDGSEVTW